MEPSTPPVIGDRVEVFEWDSSKTRLGTIFKIDVDSKNIMVKYDGGGAPISLPIKWYRERNGWYWSQEHSNGKKT